MTNLYEQDSKEQNAERKNISTMLPYANSPARI